MVDPRDLDEMLRLTRGVFKTIVSSDPGSSEPSIDRDVIFHDMVAEDDILEELIECLDAHDPCPLECDDGDSGCIVRLRRKDTITNYVGGLDQDEQNPLNL